MHNVVAIPLNAVISVAKKVEDNVLCIMTALAIVLQPTTLQNPVASPLRSMLKAPNTLVIKQVRMPTGKLKAAKLWPQPVEARA